MHLPKYLSTVLAVCLLMTSGCSSANTSGIPSDFVFMIDAHNAGNGAPQNVNIRINAQGEGRYERYDTGGAIQQDANDLVTYEKTQVVQAGDFRLDENELRQLWKTIHENNFFALTGDYRMEIGSSYAFIWVEADGRRHQVFNIGMEVPEIRAIVEAVNRLLPASVELDYGAGHIP